MSTTRHDMSTIGTLFYYRMPSAKKIKKYSPEDMQQAVDAVHRGMSVASASKQYKIPRITLLYKAKGKYPVDCRMGPETILTSVEENLLVKWLLSLADSGFPATRLQLLDSVQMLVTKLNRSNPFKNNRPGKKWFRCFLTRHPQLSERLTQNLTKSRSDVSEKKVREWFQEIEDYVKTKGLAEVFHDPKRVFNTDETAFFLCPKGVKALIRKGDKTAYNFTSNDEKECLTTLITANAAGMLVPPMIMFNYERIPAHITNLMPQGWGIGKSESGWMTGQSFYEFVANIFYPWVITNNIQLPVVLFVDGHSSHLTMELSNFCIENRIELIALYPNATHILQPMDVAIFHPLKSAWRKGVQKFKVTNEGMKLKRENFGPLLKEVIEQNLTPEMFKNGFRTCGLFPLDADAVPYHKYCKALDPVPKTSETKTHDDVQGTIKALELLEFKIGKEKVDIFKNSGELWDGDIEDTSLFLIWRELVLETKTNQNGVDQVEIAPEVETHVDEIPEPRCERENKTPVKDTDKKITILQNVCINPISRVNPNVVVPSTSNNIILDDMTNVPTPFKTSLFWPKPTASKKPKRAKDKVPSVATSEQWQSYHRKKQEDKENKEREKEERKRKRVEAKLKKEKEKERKSQRKKAKGKQLKQLEEETSSDSSFEVCVESEGEGDNWAHNSSDTDEEYFYHGNKEIKTGHRNASKRIKVKPERKKGEENRLSNEGVKAKHSLKSQAESVSNSSNEKSCGPAEEWEQQSTGSMEEVNENALLKIDDFVIIKYNDSYYPGDKSVIQIFMYLTI